MTKLRFRVLVILVIAAIVWYVFRGPSTADKVRAIGGSLGRDHMSMFTGWTSAHLAGAKITDEKLRDIDLESLSTVKVVNLTDTAITSDGLATVGRWTQIKQLSLTNSPGIDDRGIPLLVPLKALNSLGLHGTSVSDDGLRHLADLPSLTHLTLSRTRVGDDGVKHLGRLRNLTYLYLSRTAITDDGVAHLSELHNLTGLYLDGTQITDAALEHLTGLTKLQALNLSETAVTDAAMDSVAKLPKLSWLNVKNTQVTEARADALRKRGGIRIQSSPDD